METQSLRDPEIFPSEKVLKETLGNDIYAVFKSFMDTVTGAGYSLAQEWNYYNDGKSWLCKVIYKKKTVCWLSIWDGHFQIGFFFTEKHLEAIAALDIAESIKEDLCKAKPIAKLLPMIFKISRKEQLNDLLKVVAFKKGLK
jgi:hypothetical protein